MFVRKLGSAPLFVRNHHCPSRVRRIGRLSGFLILSLSRDESVWRADARPGGRLHTLPKRRHLFFGCSPQSCKWSAPGGSAVGERCTWCGRAVAARRCLEPMTLAHGFTIEISSGHRPRGRTSRNRPKGPLWPRPRQGRPPRGSYRNVLVVGSRASRDGGPRRSGHLDISSAIKRYRIATRL